MKKKFKLIFWYFSSGCGIISGFYIYCYDTLLSIAYPAMKPFNEHAKPTSLGSPMGISKEICSQDSNVMFGNNGSNGSVMLSEILNTWVY